MSREHLDSLLINYGYSNCSADLFDCTGNCDGCFYSIPYVPGSDPLMPNLSDFISRFPPPDDFDD